MIYICKAPSSKAYYMTEYMIKWYTKNLMILITVTVSGSRLSYTGIYLLYSISCELGHASTCYQVPCRFSCRVNLYKWPYKLVTAVTAPVPPRNLTYQKWPSLKGTTFAKPSFWVSMFGFRGCKCSYNPTQLFLLGPLFEGTKVVICPD